jgi:hypothetical protein
MMMAVAQFFFPSPPCGGGVSDFSCAVLPVPHPVWTSLRSVLTTLSHKGRG